MPVFNEMEHKKIREYLYEERSKLSDAEWETLETHLQNCSACRAYARGVANLEGELRRAFHTRWDGRQLPSLNPGVRGYYRSRALPMLAVLGMLVVLILAIVLRSKLVQRFSAVEPTATEAYILARETSPIVGVLDSKSTSTSKQTGSSEQLIAFVSLRDGNREIYVMDSLGENPTNLTRNPAQDYAPVWSPDGERIAFISDRTGQPEVFSMGAGGSGVRQLSDVPRAKAYGEPSWSPDGEKLAVQLILMYPDSGEAYTQIYIIAANGAGSTAMTQTEFPLSDLEPKWSPAGSRIASRTLGIANAYSRGAPSSEPEWVRLSRGLAKVGALAWSPDGEHLAYFANCQYCVDDEDLTPTVHLIDADGSNPQALYAFEDRSLYSVGMSWSPDGAYLVMLGAEAGGTQYLYLMSADGSQLTQIADLPVGSMNTVPSWSPDGSRLVYALQENGEAGIYILDLQARLKGEPGGGLTRLVSSRRGDSSPRWQP